MTLVELHSTAVKKVLMHSLNQNLYFLSTFLKEEIFLGSRLEKNLAGEDDRRHEGSLGECMC